MNKDYLIYKLADRVKAASRIDSSLFPQYGVKRGLRNEDGSGVLVGLTNVGNVVGYRREEDGSLTPVEGKLFYRGYELSELVAPLRKEKRLGFEEVAYLLLSGDQDLTLIVPCPPKSFTMVRTSEPSAFIRRSSTCLCGTCSFGFRSPFL